MKSRWWVGWQQAESASDRPRQESDALIGSWERGCVNGQREMYALVEADRLLDAENEIFRCFPGLSHWRFLERKPHDWTPSTFRFPVKGSEVEELKSRIEQLEAALQAISRSLPSQSESESIQDVTEPRRERVTLEFTLAPDAGPPCLWDWQKFAEGHPLELEAGEYVRVVPAEEIEAEMEFLATENEVLRRALVGAEAEVSRLRAEKEQGE